jgi:hypothetical protein
MCGLLGRDDYIKEDEILDSKTKEVEKLVSDLKNLLSPYWEL